MEIIGGNLTEKQKKHIRNPYKKTKKYVLDLNAVGIGAALFYDENKDLIDEAVNSSDLWVK